MNVTVAKAKNMYSDYTNEELIRLLMNNKENNHIAKTVSQFIKSEVLNVLATNASTMRPNITNKISELAQLWFEIRNRLFIETAVVVNKANFLDMVDETWERIISNAIGNSMDNGSLILSSITDVVTQNLSIYQ